MQGVPQQTVRHQHAPVSDPDDPDPLHERLLPSDPQIASSCQRAGLLSLLHSRDWHILSTVGADDHLLLHRDGRILNCAHLIRLSDHRLPPAYPRQHARLRRRVPRCLHLHTRASSVEVRGRLGLHKVPRKVRRGKQNELFLPRNVPKLQLLAPARAASATFSRSKLVGHRLAILFLDSHIGGRAGSLDNFEELHIYTRLPTAEFQPSKRVYHR